LKIKSLKAIGKNQAFYRASLDKEQLKETLSKKKTEPDLLEEIEEKIENEIEEVLAPQPALVPIPVSESASEPREVR